MLQNSCTNRYLFKVTTSIDSPKKNRGHRDNYHDPTLTENICIHTGYDKYLDIRNNNKREC